MNSIVLEVDRLQIYRMSFLFAPVRWQHIKNVEDEKAQLVCVWVGGWLVVYNLNAI